MRNFLIFSSAAATLLAAAPAAAQQTGSGPIPAEQVQQLIDTLKQRNEQVRTLSERVRELEARTARAEADSGRLEMAEKAIAVASLKNQSLVSIGEEIIVKFENRSLGKRVLAGEPLTQLYRVRLQNELQAYRDKIAELGFYPEKELQPAQPAPASD